MARSQSPVENVQSHKQECHDGAPVLWAEIYFMRYNVYQLGSTDMNLTDMHRLKSGRIPKLKTPGLELE